MQINVTHMVEDCDDMPLLSGSQAELGNDAGRITWNNSAAYGKDNPLLTTEEEKDAARDHFREYGAWTAEEIAAWDDSHLQAITCQDVAAAIREMEVAEDYNDYVRLCEEGTCSARLFRDEDGEWWCVLGL